MAGEAWLQVVPLRWESVAATPHLISQWVRKQRQDIKGDLAISLRALPNMDSLLPALPH